MNRKSVLISGIQFNTEDLAKIKRLKPNLYQKMIDLKATSKDLPIIKAVLNSDTVPNNPQPDLKDEFKEYQDKAQKWDSYMALAREEYKARSRIKQIAQERAKLLGITEKYKEK